MLREMHGASIPPDTRESKMNKHTLSRRLRQGYNRYDDDGELEKRCPVCGEYWPADLEFFVSAPDMLREMHSASIQPDTRKSKMKRAKLSTLILFRRIK